MVHLQVRKPNAILFDISGTVAKSSFIEKVLYPYISSNIRTYLEQNWDSESVRQDMAQLRLASAQNPNAPQIGELDREDAITTTVDYVAYCMEHKMESNALTLLRFHMWFEGYRQGSLQTPVYSDAAIQLQKWHCQDSLSLYVVSNGWSQATARFLEHTNHGNMNLLIADHFDTRIGKLFEPATFVKVATTIGQAPKDVLFLTKDGHEGSAALQAGLNVVLVLTHRKDVEKLDETARKIARVRSFNEIDLV